MASSPKKKAINKCWVPLLINDVKQEHDQWQKRSLQTSAIDDEQDKELDHQPKRKCVAAYSNGEGKIGENGKLSFQSWIGRGRIRTRIWDMFRVLFTVVFTACNIPDIQGASFFCVQLREFLCTWPALSGLRAAATMEVKTSANAHALRLPEFLAMWPLGVSAISLFLLW